jgi:hypothetical protein
MPRAGHLSLTANDNSAEKMYVPLELLILKYSS